jgi:uncharacterized damage-inducible protein DinB
MTSPRTRPPFVADERTQLVGWLDLQRAIVRWKCEGVSDEDAHRVVLPTSPLMTLAGIVAHLRWTEHLWFEVLFLNGPKETNPQFIDEPEDSDMIVDGLEIGQLLAEYEQQCARSNEIIAAYPLDTPGQNTEFGSGSSTLRWMLIHMVEETARHAGHADVIRELLDGHKGYY